jgi:hypothetical protein
MTERTLILTGASEPLDWDQVVQWVERDLAVLGSLARETGAFVRSRGLVSVSDLLRLILAYACGETSLKRVGLWAATQGLCDLSEVAISMRLRTAGRWLGCLVARLMVRRRDTLPEGALRIRIIDATTANRLGSKSTDWRVHLGLDLAAVCIDEVELTDAHGGETLVRHAAGPGEIILADAGYAHRAGLGSVLSSGAHVVVRMNWQNLPLRDEQTGKIDVVAWLTGPGFGDVAERSVLVDTANGTFPVRLVVGRLPAEAAAAARKRSAHQARKKKHKVDPRTLQAAGFCLLVTSLPAELWSARQILDLYRIRWQIEMHSKRMKSIVLLGDIPARHPDVVQSYILGKLILALLVEDLVMHASEHYAGWTPSQRPSPNLWQLTQTCWQAVKNAIRGAPVLRLQQLLLPQFQRYLTVPKRKRPNQLEQAKAMIQALADMHCQLPLPCPVPCLS